MYGELERGIQVLVERLDGKRPLGRPRHIWEDKNKMDLQEMRWGA